LLFTKAPGFPLSTNGITFAKKFSMLHFILPLILVTTITPNSTLSELGEEVGVDISEEPKILKVLGIESDEETDETKNESESSERDSEETGKTVGCIHLKNKIISRILRDFKLEQNGQVLPPLNVEIQGLKTIKPDTLWELFGEKPTVFTFEQAAALLYHLDQLGLFLSVRPILKVQDIAHATLEITLEEFPTVQRVVFQGIESIAEKELWEKFKKAKDRDKEWKKNKNPVCGSTKLINAWVAYYKDGEFHPGVVYGGLDELIARMKKHMHHRGFKLATAKWELAQDGTLTILVDEGRLEKITLEGAHPRLLPKIESLVDMKPGRVFLKSDVDAAGKRVANQFPFFDHKIKYHLDGHSLTLKLRSDQIRTNVRLVDLIRHTPVTGFAPGLQWTTWYYDAADRVHLALDGLFNINTGRKNRIVDGGVLTEISAKERTDFAGGLKVVIPDLRIMEFGANFHALTDTADRWKMSPVDSYIYSFLINRPDSSYFRRTGFDFFLSSILFNHFILGAEYRRDRYDSLSSLNKVPRLFRRGEMVRQNQAINNGTLGSVVLRLEYTTQPRTAQQLLGVHRDPERSLATEQARQDRQAFYQTVNTLEIARPSLGGDLSLRFVRLVADHRVYLPIYKNRHGIRLRARGAGLLGDGHLPLQKQEALGGFSGVRGYDYGELSHGSFSWLGSIEYEVHGLAFFSDIGSVRVDNRWVTPKVGLGVAFGFKEAGLVLAWRTDDKAQWLPALRLLFQRTF
jgi:hypothetical protein